MRPRVLLVWCAPACWAILAHRMGKDRRSNRRTLDPEDVLANRGRTPTARELLDLIREVNPNGHDLSAREAERRHAQRRGLQSLLIRRFAEEIRVDPDTRAPGVVALHHAPLDTHAGHAALDELDEDAREIVRCRLDGARDEAPEAPAIPEEAEPEEGGGRSVRELLDEGRAAIDAYDYDLARVRLEEAHALAGDDTEVARTLLALLVDCLAADHAALAIADRLPAVVLRDPDVRLALAVAASRAGAFDRARAWVAGDRSARAAEVLVALAHAALDGGDHERAALDAAEARARDATHPGIAAIERQVAVARAEQRQPLEAELGRALDEGRLSDAAPLARGILASWPESEIGRRALHAVEEHQRSSEGRSLVAAAEEALGRGERAEAISLLRRALAAGILGEDAARAEARCAEIEAEERARAEQARLDAVAHALAEADPVPGLVAYAALDRPSRDRVRQAVAMPHLAWLEAIGVQGSGSRVRAAALAVTALHRAGAVVAEDPEGALALLSSHGKLLAGVAQTAAIAAEARARKEARRREAARRRIEEAAAAIEGGAVEQAEETLRSLPRGDLDADALARLSGLTARLSALHEERRLRATFDRLRREGALVRARDIAGDLFGGTDGEERERWVAAWEELSAEIRAAFRVRADRTPLPLRSLADLDLDRVTGLSHELLPGTTEVVVAHTREDWVFLRRVDLANKRIVERVILRTPTPLELVHQDVVDDRLVLVGKAGSVLEIALADWDVSGWYDASAGSREAALPAPRPEEAQARTDPPAHASGVGHAAASPGTRMLWVSGNAGNGDRFTRVIDLSRGRVVRDAREQAERIVVRSIRGTEDPLIAVVRRGPDSLRFHEPGGTPIGDPIRLDAIPDAIVAYPGRDEILVVMGPVAPTQAGRSSRALPRGGPPVRFCALTPAGSATPEQVIDGLDDLTVTAALADRETGMVYLRGVPREDLVTTRPEPAQLLAYRAARVGPPGLTPVFRCDLPAGTSLVQAPDGGGVRAVFAEEDDLAVIELGAAAPPSRPAPPLGSIPARNTLAGRVQECHRPEVRKAAVQAVIQALRSESRVAWKKRIAAAREDGSVDRLLELGFALQACLDFDAARSLFEWTRERYPGNAEVRLALARPAADAWRWPEVRELLTGAEPTSLDPINAQHLCHLLGLSLVHACELAEALRVAEIGRGFSGGKCDLGFLVALATPLDEPREDAGAPPWSADEACVRELLRAVRTADDCLARPDPAGARSALRRLSVVGSNEVQSLARAAEAWLVDVEPAEPHRFDKAYALAAFAAAHADRSFHARRELLIPWGTWDAERLDALAQRARAWLDETLGPAWPRGVKP